jgi:hypothetical protein
MKLKPKDRSTWKKWFAWHPIIIDNVTVWLEIVERRRDPDIFDWVYSYRLIDRDRKIYHRVWRAIGRRAAERQMEENIKQRAPLI